MSAPLPLEERVEAATKIWEGIKDTPRIPELDFVPTQRYNVSTMEDVLFPIIEANDILLTPGAFFGDESKGKMIDMIARHPDIRMVYRPNSGENAGHTVTEDGIDYIFHLMPSGILVDGIQCLIGPECVMDPLSFLQGEVKQLIEHNREYKDKLFVGDVHITTPYHKLMDFMDNPTNSSTLKGISPSHSSKVKKRGIRLRHIFMDEDIQETRLRKDMEDYISKKVFKGWTDDDILERCEKMNVDIDDRIPSHVIDFIKAGKEHDIVTIDKDTGEIDRNFTDERLEKYVKAKVDFLIDLYRTNVRDNEAFPRRANTRQMWREGLKKGWKGLIEPAQSYFLRNSNVVHWSSATSADTGADGTIAAAGFNSRDYKVAVINVAKVPASRVGLGANPISLVGQTWFSDQGIDTLDKMVGKCMDTPAIEKVFMDSIQDNGLVKPAIYTDTDGSEYLAGEALAIAWSRDFDEKGASTQKPRVLGFFDCVAHWEVEDVQGDYLALSALDRFDDCEKVAVCIGYVYNHAEGKDMDYEETIYRNGDIIRPGDALPCEEVLYHCQPILKVIDGWKGNPIASKLRDPDLPLPTQVQDFIATVEDATKAEVIAIGNGKEADNMIFLEKPSIGSSHARL